MTCASVFRPRFPEHRGPVERDPDSWKCELEGPHLVHALGALRWSDALPIVKVVRVNQGRDGKADGRANRRGERAPLPDPPRDEARQNARRGRGEKDQGPRVPMGDAVHGPPMLGPAEAVRPADELEDVEPAEAIPAVAGDELEDLEQLGAVATQYAVDSVPANTRRTYQSQWRAFVSWCQGHRLPFLPAAPETVALYVTHLAHTGRKVATIEVALSALSQAHQLAGQPSPRRDPIVFTIMKGIRHTHGTEAHQKAPLLDDQLSTILGALPDTNAGRRDRALLLTAWLGALRRSEVVALDVADVRFVPQGVVIRVKRGKRDQEGKGTIKGLPRGLGPVDPVDALSRWIGERTTGPLFLAVDQWDHVGSQRLGGRAVAELVQRHAGAAGNFSGHSLRAGFVTAAARKGVAEHWIAEQTGHKSIPTLREYIRNADRFSHNAGVGLLVAPAPPSPPPAPSSAAAVPEKARTRIPPTLDWLKNEANWQTDRPEQERLFSEDPASQEEKS